MTNHNALKGIVQGISDMLDRKNLPDDFRLRLLDLIERLQSLLVSSDDAHGHQYDDVVQLKQFMASERFAFDLKKQLGEFCREREHELYKAQLYSYKLKDEQTRSQTYWSEEYFSVNEELQQLSEQVTMLLKIKALTYSLNYFEMR